MKTIAFKCLMTALFLVLAIFAAGFTAASAQHVYAESEAVSVQTDTQPASDDWLIFLEADSIVS